MLKLTMQNKSLNRYLLNWTMEILFNKVKMFILIYELNDN